MSSEDLSGENRSWIYSIALSIVLAVLAVFSFQKVWPSHNSGWTICLGVAAGGLGGLVHEFAQSKGKLLFFTRAADGIYLGAIAGMIMGMVAGLLAVQGLFSQSTPTSTASQLSASTAPAPVAAPTPPPGNTTPSAPQTPVAIQALYAAFLAGLALKGVAEAVGGQPVSAGAGSLPVNTMVPIDLPVNPQPPKLN